MNPPSLMVNNSLGIRLDRRSFVPGDTITGHVFRSTPIICPDARLELWVHGNAVSRSGASKVSFDLLYFKQHHAVLYDGPLHITHGSGEVRWSFSITLPHRVDPRLNRGHTYRSYISLDSRPELPASYQLQGYREGGAFIEYHVGARLLLKGHGTTEELGSIHPFTIEPFRPGPHLVDFTVQRWRYRRSVKSRLLIPGVDDTKLSLRQSFKQSFNTPKDPEFKFNFYVEVPTVTQLDSPTPIPFRMLVAPDWNDTSEIIRDVPQEVKPLSIQCWVETHTQYITERSDVMDRVIETDLGLRRANVHGFMRTRIPCATAWQPIDMGEILDFQICNPTRLTFYNNQPSLTHSFCTFNIKVKHKLRWEVKCSIQGERFTAEGISDLLIKMPSRERVVESGSPESIESPALGVQESVQTSDESWVRPPDEDAPPTFLEVQIEDLRAGRRSWT
ncbi:Ff.00g077930.m01.CDS01 [Fusarium sp. VM40]|nr:Ff.00g077930.m01.CDS01 [Fusarium sp. VM40]